MRQYSDITCRFFLLRRVFFGRLALLIAAATIESVLCVASSKGAGSLSVPWIIESPPFPHKRVALVGCLIVVAPKPSCNIAQEFGWWMIVIKIAGSRIHGVWVETKADLQKALDNKEVGNPDA